MALNDYNTVSLTSAQLKVLELAARHFDEMSDQEWTAVDFIRWLRPDVPGTPEYAALRGAPITSGLTTAEQVHAAERARARERYQTDPEYRQRHLDANRRYRTKQRAA